LLPDICDKQTENKTLCSQTAVKYYEAACEYGVQKVKEVAFKWLLINLLSNFQDQAKRLREIR
jgi:BTB/POZ domain-containing protein 13